jgi:RimJ/RimL family protein N-acetyltransferase
LKEHDMKIDPLILHGAHIRLEPMRPDHLAGLQAAAAHPEIWNWTWPGADPENVATWLETSLRAVENGSDLPFSTVDMSDGAIIGGTRLMNIDLSNRVVEIGNTWLTPRFQRTPVNTDTKHLLLRHAFEVLDCNRVEFKTDANNTQSRAALANLGAVEEGIRRRHMIVPGGRVRDSAVFSIIREEWPAVKASLEAKLARPWNRIG